MSVTQWFNARREKPQAVGNYEYHRQHDNADFYVEWDSITFKFADGEYRGLEVYVGEDDTWRGVAKVEVKEEAPAPKKATKKAKNEKASDV